VSPVAYVVVIVLIGFAFDFINGFHDSANSIATIVGTRVLNPFAAVVWAAFFNFSAAFVVGTAVAKTVQSGMIEQSIVDPTVILSALLGAIAWNLITWLYGLPSSSSHALIGGYAGAAVTKAGWTAILWGDKWIKTLEFIALSPLIGMAASSASRSWEARRSSRSPTAQTTPRRRWESSSACLARPTPRTSFVGSGDC
jgi:PiT family inorganic phosphate transporter